MMANQPSLSESETPPLVFPKRKRRYKIFEQSTRTEPEKSQSIIETEVRSATTKQETIQTGRQIGIASGFLKIPQKVTLQTEFYGDDDIQLLEVPSGIQKMCTVGSQKFGVTDQFNLERPEPSMLIMNDLLVINEASVLFKSVSEIKSSTDDFKKQTNQLAASLIDLQASINLISSQGSNIASVLSEFEDFILKMREQKQQFEQKLEQLQERVDELQLLKSVQSGHFQSTQQKQELKVFIEQKGYRVELDQDEDEFAETQWIPASLIHQFVSLGRNRSTEENSSAKKQPQKESEQIGVSFHSCLGITTEKYHQILHFIAEEYKQKKNEDISLNLIFRKGRNTEKIGDQDSLEYKEVLLFIVKTSTNKIIGGFISNHLIEGQVRQDPHAFLFSLQQQSYKFKIKQQSASQAYQSSRHYLICFGSDLMISSDCLEQQSYCEWPSSYQGLNLESMSWLAGDFSFMIEHIEVYEVEVS